MTAQTINRAMAEHLSPNAPLIAETGGLNAMIVDSTALPEQAVRDIVVSAFQSAGQRCSALRVLYLQADIAESVQTMLFGAMDELCLGDPWDPSTDVGPVIDQPAKARILDHVEHARQEGRVLKQLTAPADGTFVGPTALKIDGIEALADEIFGPVLHIATFEADRIDGVVQAINDKGYGLTFGLHTRIDDRVQDIVDDLEVGNIYVNRNQIGAIVGSQPFGGEGLSGTGPKAGGPHYVPRFKVAEMGSSTGIDGRKVAADDVARALAALPPTPMEETGSIELPGPTGESNRLGLHPRGPILCLGPGRSAALAQAEAAKAVGCPALAIAPGVEHGLNGILALAELETIPDIAGVVLWGDLEISRAARRALAARPGSIIPLITEADITERCQVERHLCIDTTAAGGNASLLSTVAV